MEIICLFWLLRSVHAYRFYLTCSYFNWMLCSNNRSKQYNLFQKIYILQYIEVTEHHITVLTVIFGEYVIYLGLLIQCLLQPYIHFMYTLYYLRLTCLCACYNLVYYYHISFYEFTCVGLSGVPLIDTHIFFVQGVKMLLTQASESTLLPLLTALVRTYWWRSARLQYLQCVSNGDTAVLH